MAFLCGCDPRNGVICSTHCQWQGCTRTVHTDACIRGERVPETPEQVRARLLPEAFR